MTTTNLSDLKISGKGSANGGNYDKIHINGKGNLNGDFVCNDLKVAGSCDIYGNITTKTGKIHGASDVKGNLTAETLDLQGSTDVLGMTNVGNLEMQGAMNIKNSLTSNNIKAKGSFTVGTDLQAEIFSMQGNFNIGGLLNSGTIDAKIYASCSAREIGGEKIHIRRGRTHIFRSLIKSILGNFGLNDGLTTDSVEGDEVYLEYTTAKVVRGKNVRIGPDCVIDLVEYSNTYEKAAGAIVKEYKKI